jgi:hypothetical protein
MSALTEMAIEKQYSNTYNSLKPFKLTSPKGLDVTEIIICELNEDLKPDGEEKKC